MQFLCEDLQGLYRKKSENWGEGENKTEEIAILQGWQGIEGKSGPLNPNKNWVVYLVRCADQSMYCGITNNLEKRLEAHNLGKGGKYTRSRIPVELLGTSSEMTKSEALKLELRIKRMPAERKSVEIGMAG